MELHEWAGHLEATVKGSKELGRGGGGSMAGGGIFKMYLYCYCFNKLIDI